MAIQFARQLSSGQILCPNTCSASLFGPNYPALALIFCPATGKLAALILLAKAGC